jgi:phosphoserine aminotransferase
MFIQLAKGKVDCAKDVAAYTRRVETCLRQLLHLPNEIQLGFLKGLKEETVAVVALAITEEDEAQFMTCIIE